jgi:hypothetical protein
MYSALYKRLKGGRFAKVTQMVLIFAIAIAFLFFVAFPFLDSLITTDPIVNEYA